jgi:hypothetical protein
MTSRGFIWYGRRFRTTAGAISGMPYDANNWLNASAWSSFIGRFCFSASIFNWSLTSSGPWYVIGTVFRRDGGTALSVPLGGSGAGAAVVTGAGFACFRLLRPNPPD